MPSPGLAWIDRQGDFSLAGSPTTAPTGDENFEVWNTKLRRRVAVVTAKNVSAGGASPYCNRLSPAGTLVQCGNGRRMAWKDWNDRVTQCPDFSIVAPDDSSCIGVDASPMTLVGDNDAAAALPLAWSRPLPVDVKAPEKAVATTVATIARGRNRAPGRFERWWTVQYCSPSRAVIDVNGGDRIIIDAAGRATVLGTKPAVAACSTER